jgi:ABC-type antimicrobial peptide transport system permease subunit
MALGASPADVMWLILRDSIAMIAVGVTVGTLGAIGAGHLLQHLVEGMQPTGPSPYAITISLLVATAVAASLVPARRASQVDPMKVLRQE